jgi:hypothetical protein
MMQALMGLDKALQLFIRLAGSCLQKITCGFMINILQKRFRITNFNLEKRIAI